MKNGLVEKTLDKLYEKQAEADAKGDKITSRILGWQIKKYEKIRR